MSVYIIETLIKYANSVDRMFDYFILFLYCDALYWENDYNV